MLHPLDQLWIVEGGQASPGFTQPTPLLILQFSGHFGPLATEVHKVVTDQHPVDAGISAYMIRLKRSIDA
ncbi:hypothetical protein WL96_13750 [Burkholderia vietnamiensis]|nr:hypothetical protein WL96_13750 [Burkholderia vietnamiensis]AQT51240.1 hypothetical protein BHQ31_14975 [Burkholderia cenocepacia]